MYRLKKLYCFTPLDMIVICSPISRQIIKSVCLLGSFLWEKEFEKNNNDLIFISEIQMNQLVRETKDNFGKGFSKEYREMNEDKLVIEIVNYMKEFDMIRENKDTKEFIIMPICLKIIGKYPKDFNK